MAGLNKDGQNTRQLFDDNLPYLTDLNYIYEKGNVKEKQSFLKGIFPGCLTKEDQGFGTPLIHPMFYQNSLQIGALLRIKKEGEPGFYPNSPICTRSRGRTGITVKLLVFETSASTNSAIRAFISH